MKKVFTLFSLALATFTTQLHAQNVEEIVIFTEDDVLGSPRYSAMGGAFGSLGNDISAIHLNPAGLGVYRMDEVGVAGGFINTTSHSRFYDQTETDFDFGATVNNFGLVKKLSEEGDNNLFLGLSYNRMASYDNRFLIQGKNDDNTSILDDYVARSNGLHPNDLTLFPGLAYDVYLIDNPNNITEYERLPDDVSDIDQRLEFSSSGSRSEFGITFAGEMDMFYWGAGLNFTSITYSERRIYEESGYSGNNASEMAFDDLYEIDGNGINLRAGAIFKPVPWMRISGAFTTPSYYYRMNTSFDTEMFNFFETDSTHDYAAGGDYTYRFNDPLRLQAGMAFVLRKYGVISLDYLYQNPSKSRLSSRDFNYTEQNNTIDEALQPVHQIRAGAETRMGDFFLRGGLVYNSDPYKRERAQDYSLTYSGGLGYKAKKFTVDLSYSLRQRTENYYIYDPLFVDAAEIQKNRSTILVGFTYRY